MVGVLVPLSLAVTMGTGLFQSGPLGMLEVIMSVHECFSEHVCTCEADVSLNCDEENTNDELPSFYGPSSQSFALWQKPAPMAQWLCHRLMGWFVLGSNLVTGSNPERVLKDPRATTPSFLSH